MLMRRFLFLLLFALQAIAQAQTAATTVRSPGIPDFSGTLSFLSSDWMEGREATARGGFMAADYIASQMKLFGLMPYGDTLRQQPSAENAWKTTQTTYFQNFELIRSQVEKASLALVRLSSGGEDAQEFAPGIDFEWEPSTIAAQAEAELVFAGYGIEATAKGYNDYAGLDVRGRIVVVMDKFPGHADTSSKAYKKLGRTLNEEAISTQQKRLTAQRQGAVALVVVSPEALFKPYKNTQQNLGIVNKAMDAAKAGDPDYADAEYTIPGDTSLARIPCFVLGNEACTRLLQESGIRLTEVENGIAGNLSPRSKILKGKKGRFSISIKSESLAVRNVMGIIPGKDTSRTIIIGAHYDHLGMRNGLIYNGADDNASGTSGMLALARVWGELSEKPGCNLIFAAWTAEEKGLLGSSYFVQHTRIKPTNLSMYLNMDMISRSAPEDPSRRVLSIGTLPVSEQFRQIAERKNKALNHPFILDYWDVTGHSGSDYGSFIPAKIPVMTFFSGFHDDYHTPRDIAAKSDPEKMKDILKIVNDCLLEVIKTKP